MWIFIDLSQLSHESPFNFFFSLSWSLLLFLSHSLSYFLTTSLYLSYIYIYITHSLAIPPSFYISHTLSLSLCFSLYLYLSLSLYLSISLSLSFYLSLSLSLSLCLSYSLSYSLCPYLIHPFRLDLELSIPRSWLIKYNLESSVNYVREERGRWSTPHNIT